VLRRSLKQTGETVKGSSVSTRRIHHHLLHPSTPGSTYSNVSAATVQLNLRDYLSPEEPPSRSHSLYGFASDTIMIRSANEIHHRREVFSSAYRHRMPPVSFLQYELPSGKTPSPCEIHRKTVVFSIDRIDTNRQFLDQLPLCKGFAEQSPASLTWTPPQ
jgi:hypothetical protein